MDKPKVLVIGLEPALIDFSEESYRRHPGLNAETLRAGLVSSQQTLGEIGFDANLCMIGFGETAGKVVRGRLEETSFDYILFGAGLRLNARNTVLFETIINIVHRHAPHAKLCFNTSATETAEAIQRSAAGYQASATITS